MESRGRHRGKNPRDESLFTVNQRESLIEAASDLAWLLEKSYPLDASLKLVGDRFQLRDRQRLAVGRATASPSNVAKRHAKCIDRSSLEGQAVSIDAFNVVLTIESILSGGIVLRCQDGLFRDMASVHGTYRTVEETEQAIDLIGFSLAKEPSISKLTWWIDKPVSNSGRLRSIILARMARWHESIQVNVELVPDPDYVLKRSTDIVVTSDSIILDHCRSWHNLVADLWDSSLAFPSEAKEWVIDFSPAALGG